MAIRIGRQELAKKLEEIDLELSAERVRVTARPFEAHRRLVKTLGLRTALLLGPSGPSPLFRNICSWYERRYGDRMLVDFKIGKKPILLRGLLFYIRFPLTYGNVSVPILEQVEGLTEDMVKSLTQEEVAQIIQQYTEGHYAFTALDNLRSAQLPITGAARDLVKRGLHDLEAAVSLAETVEDSQGSLFHTQEAAEKFLKAALMLYGATEKEVKRLGHNLQKILSQLCQKDLKFAYIAEPVRVVALKGANIRHRDLRVRLERVVPSVNAALHICSFVAGQWELERVRGGSQPNFEPGKLYTNLMGLNYKCLKLAADERGIELAELALLGNKGIDAVFKQRSYYSFLYAEITEPDKIAQLERRYREVVLGDVGAATND
ncbi:MAG: HEPN domain-containing protein [Terriglobales bacterium]